jgi:hypothetical protein
MTTDTTTDTTTVQTADNAAAAEKINATVAAYEAMRKRIFDALVVRECPGWWLSTAFKNEGPEGIRSIEADAEGIHAYGSCWTSQTGGSTEFWEFTLPYDALDATEQAGE